MDDMIVSVVRALSCVSIDSCSHKYVATQVRIVVLFVFSHTCPKTTFLPFGFLALVRIWSRFQKANLVFPGPFGNGGQRPKITRAHRFLYLFCAQVKDTENSISEEYNKIMSAEAPPPNKNTRGVRGLEALFVG